VGPLPTASPPAASAATGAAFVAVVVERVPLARAFARRLRLALDGLRPRSRVAAWMLLATVLVPSWILS
jgi:hypothetical protein